MTEFFFISVRIFYSSRLRIVSFIIVWLIVSDARIRIRRKSIYVRVDFSAASLEFYNISYETKYFSETIQTNGRNEIGRDKRVGIFIVNSRPRNSVEIESTV